MIINHISINGWEFSRRQRLNHQVHAALYVHRATGRVAEEIIAGPTNRVVGLAIRDAHGTSIGFARTVRDLH
jgi:hypothetical protein